MLNLGSFSKWLERVKGVGIRSTFFRNFMVGLLESQKYSLTQSIQSMNIAELITILEDIDVLKFKNQEHAPRKLVVYSKVSQYYQLS